MTLCSDYCEHDYCSHGFKLCEHCPDCEKAVLLRAQQRQHEASIIRQKSKLRRIES